jgi:hypothetical protein
MDAGVDTPSLMDIAGGVQDRRLTLRWLTAAPLVALVLHW